MAASLERASVAFTPTYQPFLVREKRFTLQYAQIYARRLDQLRPVVRASAAAVWGGGFSPCASGGGRAAVSRARAAPTPCPPHTFVFTHFYMAPPRSRADRKEGVHGIEAGNHEASR